MCSGMRHRTEQRHRLQGHIMDKSKELDGRVVVLTGAGNGLGAAMARALAQAGASLLLCDRDAAGLERVRQELEPTGAAVTLAVLDITDDTQVERVLADALAQFGRLDVLINNAGTGAQIVRQDFISRPLNSWDIPADKWRRIIDVNAIAPFVFARAVIPAMLRQGWGRIINVSTTWETMLRPGFGSYGPSKAALESMTCGMARELEGSGVTVNTIIPGGPVDTAQVPSDIGVARETLLRPDVMNALVLWLLSSAADGLSAQRFTAAGWDPHDADNVSVRTEPAAWPQLVKPIVMKERGHLS